MTNLTCNANLLQMIEQVGLLRNIQTDMTNFSYGYLSPSNQTIHAGKITTINGKWADVQAAMDTYIPLTLATNPDDVAAQTAFIDLRWKLQNFQLEIGDYYSWVYPILTTPGTSQPVVAQYYSDFGKQYNQLRIDSTALLSC